MFDKKYLGHDLEDQYEYKSITNDFDKYYKCKICKQEYIFAYSNKMNKFNYRKSPKFNVDYVLLSCNEHIIKNLLE